MTRTFLLPLLLVAITFYSLDTAPLLKENMSDVKAADTTQV
jgi:hypothetical protein